MPYCDGNSFAGDSTVVVNDSTTLNFRGVKIRESIVASVKASWKAGNPTLPKICSRALMGSFGVRGRQSNLSVASRCSSLLPC